MANAIKLIQYVFASNLSTLMVIKKLRETNESRVTHTHTQKRERERERERERSTE
jgi:hypothetical protein